MRSTPFDSHPGSATAPRLDGFAGLPAALQGTVRAGLIATYARWKGQDLFMMAIGRVQSVRPARFYIVGGPIYKTKGSQFSEQELPKAGRRTGSGRSSGIRAVSGGNGRRVPAARRGDTRQYTSGAVRSDDRRGDGLQPPGGRGERRRRVVFTEGKDALGVTPGDPDALAQAMDRLIDNDTERHAIGERARATALTRYARERLGERSRQSTPPASGTGSSLARGKDGAVAPSGFVKSEIERGSCREWTRNRCPRLRRRAAGVARPSSTIRCRSWLNPGRCIWALRHQSLPGVRTR